MLFKSLAIASLNAIHAHGAYCYPTWSSGSDYFTGSLVSATITTTSTTTASDGTVSETVTSETKNFKCLSGSQPSLSHCPGFDPSNAVQQAAAWSDEGVCSGTTATLTTSTPTAKPSPSRWTHTGCPEQWISGGLYEGGDVVEQDGNVYSCSTAMGANLWCSLNAYKPGDSDNWEMAWTLLGSCEGNISPITYPNGGCPNEFDSSATYESGDVVELDGLVYQCRSWPNSGWCSQAGYEPDGEHYHDAWTHLGYCEGTIAPTTSPSFNSLALVAVGGGCPKEYISSNLYETGDQVSVPINNEASVVYECKSWPNGSYCNSGLDFAPGTESGNLGWTKKGYCDATLSPTKTPVAYAPVEKCRWYNGTQPVIIKQWSDADRSTYVAGTRVRKESTIYKCKGWPFFLWCQTSGYEPAVGTAWMDAWTKAGECKGALDPTVSPSASPTSSPLSEPLPDPSFKPSSQPSVSLSPSSQSSSSPSSLPSFIPSSQPSFLPSSQPSLSPSSQPSLSPSEGQQVSYESVGNGMCVDGPKCDYYEAACNSAEVCLAECPKTDYFRGVTYMNEVPECVCLYDVGNTPTTSPPNYHPVGQGNGGTGLIEGVMDIGQTITCLKYIP
eukprot:scaffold110845_cov23-Cyclotella_meneghiniana.AAC.1